MGGEHRGARGRSRGAPRPERPRFSLRRGRVKGPRLALPAPTPTPTPSGAAGPRRRDRAPSLRSGAGRAAGAGGDARLCLLPLGAAPPPSAGRAAGCAGRAGGRHSAAERCCWRGSLEKVVGCLSALAASWRSRASRLSTSSSPSRHRHPRPPRRPPAGPSAGTPTSCRR